MRELERIVDTGQWDTGNSNREDEVAASCSRQTREERGIPGKTKDNNAAPKPDTGASVLWNGESELDERSRSLAYKCKRCLK